MFIFMGISLFVMNENDCCLEVVILISVVLLIKVLMFLVIVYIM